MIIDSILKWICNQEEKWCIKQRNCKNCQNKCPKKYRKYIKEKRKQLKEQNNG